MPSHRPLKRAAVSVSLRALDDASAEKKRHGAAGTKLRISPLGPDPNRRNRKRPAARATPAVPAGAEAGASAQRADRLNIGNQTVHFADSRDMSFLRSNSVDFIMTSPPYWNLKDYGHDGQIGQCSYDEYLDQLNAVWDECYRVAKPDAVFVLNVGNRRHDKTYLPIGFDIYSCMRRWKLWDTLIWYIPNALPQPASYIERLFDNKYEFLLLFTKDGGRSGYTFHKPRVPNKYRDADPRKHKMNEKGRCLGNIIRVPAYRPPNVRSMNYHIASYPEELVSLMLHTMTDKGDAVLDPFLGSGTTLKVARAMGRKGVGVEINRGYRGVIRGKIAEKFVVPDWKSIDVMHSTTMQTGTERPRKAHLLKGEACR